MVSPTTFGFNTETALDNAFMKQVGSGAETATASKAASEHACAVSALEAADVHVVVLPGAGNPDEAFPNNWLGFLPPRSAGVGGDAMLFPMAAPSRQAEVREDLLAALRQPPLSAPHVHDLREHDLARAGAVLEGTGALVLDRVASIAYCALSARADAPLAAAWAAAHGFTLHTFTAHCANDNGQDVPVYHTNVVLSVGAHAAVLAAECVRDATQRQALLASLTSSGKHVLCITEEQVSSFAGNVLQVRSRCGGGVWVMSSAARESLAAGGQLGELLAPPGAPAASALVHSPLPCIEAVGGGSMRCLLAEAWPCALGVATGATAKTPWPAGEASQ
jgi:hypothetical protein